MWIGNVKDKLKDNPFLAEQAFESMQAQEAYLEEFKLQLDEEYDYLKEQHAEVLKQEQRKASVLLRQQKKLSVSVSHSHRPAPPKKKKKKRLFGWFRRNKKSKEPKEEEKVDNLLASPSMDSQSVDVLSVDAPTPMSLMEETPGGDADHGIIKSYRARKGSEENTSMDYYSLYFILLCLLLRHYNNGRNFLVFSISQHSIRMPEMGDKILEIFGIMTKCGNIYRTLCYLKVLMKVLATEAAYFDDVLERLADIKEYLDDEKVCDSA